MQRELISIPKMLLYALVTILVYVIRRLSSARIRCSATMSICCPRP